MAELAKSWAEGTILTFVSLILDKDQLKLPCVLVSVVVYGVCGDDRTARTLVWI